MNYLDEKSRQVSPGTAVALGISLSTRHDKAGELVEMLNFATMVAQMGYEDLVTSVFYDSNSCTCNFELADGLTHADQGALAILHCAKQTITQFEWDGEIFHGAPLHAADGEASDAVVNDLTDEFDTRLAALQRANAPKSEQDAAIDVYERVRTARAICHALLGKDVADASVVSVAIELGRVSSSLKT
ncbi:hypothetical protein AEP_01632 [Curvibacter sp. AEP1-3]|uniref:hypothetical protein n=1 Tax=Curvibacter sp. AEP1-3 TaxID=1844971 RepID=UPI000B554C4D|nr:hypothetical protein [Curvibacter sp. AEP1-3]ARV18576.1 hypothetical protein AEP_01632 [Curvibacter sp. AEP1-3]